MIYKITEDILNKCIIELNKNENREKININLIDPIISNITNKLHPYMITIFGMYILILILIISIMFILIMNKNK
jgi:hypothetical protein